MTPIDPVTAGLILANTIISLLAKVYEDTPLATRQANIQWWQENFSVPAGKFLTTGKLP